MTTEIIPLLVILAFAAPLVVSDRPRVYLFAPVFLITAIPAGLVTIHGPEKLRHRRLPQGRQSTEFDGLGRLVAKAANSLAAYPLMRFR